MTPPRRLTKAQAARCAGVSRTQIARLLKAGKISFEPDPNGISLIEPSELLRVYPLADLALARSSRDSAHRAAHRDNRSSNSDNPLQPLVDELRQDKERLQRDLDEARADAKAERNRLLRMIEDQGDQLRQITDQRQARSRPWWSRWWPGSIK